MLQETDILRCLEKFKKLNLTERHSVEYIIDFLASQRYSLPAKDAVASAVRSLVVAAQQGGEVNLK